MEEQNIIDSKLNLLAKSSLVVFIGIFLSKILAYIYKIVIGRYYGPESYGFFSLGIMVLGIFTAFVGFGLSEGLHRFLPIYLSKKEKEKYKYAISFSKKVFAISGVVGTILMFFLSEFIAEYFFHSPELAIYLKIFSFVIPFNLFSGVYFSVIRANEKIKEYSFGINILQSVPKAILILVFVFIGIGAPLSITLSFLIGILPMTFFGLFYSKRIKEVDGKCKKNGIEESEKKMLRKEFFSYSWPLFLFSVVSSLIFWVDNFAIGFLEGAYSVGIYNAAIPIAFLLLIPSEMFMQLFFPMITKEIHLGNKKISSEIAKQISKWIFIINIPILILIIIFPGVFMNLFWGAEYIGAKNSLVFLSIGYFFFSIASVSNNILSSVGKSKIILSNLALVSVLNLTLNFMLIPIYGITGAGFATMVSLIVWSFALIAEAGYFSKIFPFRKKMINVFACASATGILLVSLKKYFDFGLIGMFLFAIIYLGIYFVSLFFSGALDKNDLRIVGRVKGIFIGKEN